MCVYENAADASSMAQNEDNMMDHEKFLLL